MLVCDGWSQGDTHLFGQDFVWEMCAAFCAFESDRDCALRRRAWTWLLVLIQRLIGANVQGDSARKAGPTDGNCPVCDLTLFSVACVSCISSSSTDYCLPRALSTRTLANMFLGGIRGGRSHLKTVAIGGAYECSAITAWPASPGGLRCESQCKSSGRHPLRLEDMCVRITCTNTYIYTCWMNMHTYIYVHMHIPLIECVKKLCTYIYTCMYMYIYICICMYHPYNYMYAYRYIILS